MDGIRNIDISRQWSQHGNPREPVGVTDGGSKRGLKLGEESSFSLIPREAPQTWCLQVALVSVIACKELGWGGGGGLEPPT